MSNMLLIKKELNFKAFIQMIPTKLRLLIRIFSLHKFITTLNKIINNNSCKMYTLNVRIQKIIFCEFVSQNEKLLLKSLFLMLALSILFLYNNLFGNVFTYNKCY